ncbi:MAG: SDR family oxidoreductase [Myxococcales bacterium]|nr:SDR family oxidoreductase [Myxococcales bacterium]
MLDSLQGKRALVTGGSRGLGRAICRALTEAGARVAFTFSRDEEGAAATVAACAPADAEGHRASVLDAAATALLVRALEARWGGLDILVNNAGISQNLPLALLEEEDFDQVMDVNVKGTFLTSKAVLRGMIKRKGGVILNIGSLAGSRTIEAPVHFCASKAAVEGMTRALAKEVARYGIRVNCLAPGLLEDGLGRNLPDHRLAAYVKHCALGRVGAFDEVARFAVFLVSDQCPYLSGATIGMDGGI